MVNYWLKNGEQTFLMEYLTKARRISILLHSNINLNKKFELCVMQIYLIKKYLKKIIIESRSDFTETPIKTN